MDHLAADGITVLIPPDAKTRSGTRPGWDGGRYAFMRAVLEEPEGRWRYARRQGMIEPVFADLKFNRRIDRFLRRGRGACSSERKLAAATLQKTGDEPVPAPIFRDPLRSGLRRCDHMDTVFISGSAMEWNGRSVLDWGAGTYETTAAELEPVEHVVVERARISEGEDVVDGACGTGNAALIVEACGARVIGVDAAPRLIEVARERERERERAAGVVLDFLEGDLLALPTDDPVADVALSVFRRDLANSRPAATRLHARSPRSAVSRTPKY